ncbi:MAG: hypothetical protein ACXVZO_10510 [Gaiellaceae bacterium]
MTPYEVYFYSSGVVEDRWWLKDLRLNKVTAMLGYALGGFPSFALMPRPAFEAASPTPRTATFRCRSGRPVREQKTRSASPPRRRPVSAANCSTSAAVSAEEAERRALAADLSNGTPSHLSQGHDVD